MNRTLKEWRIRRDLTQVQLAEKLGVSVSTYNAWERNTNLIKIGNVPLICDVLEVSPQDIIFFDEESYLKYDMEEVK